MNIVSDASAFLAVALSESERAWIINKTTGFTIISPEILPYEIGKALIAMNRKGRLNQQEIKMAYSITQSIPVKLVPIKVHDAIDTAILCETYASDAYYLQCCLEHKLPLLSLDKKMLSAANQLGIKVVK